MSEKECISKDTKYIRNSKWETVTANSESQHKYVISLGKVEEYMN